MKIYITHYTPLTILKKNIRALNKGGLLVRFSMGRNKTVEYKLNWDKINEFKTVFDDLYYDIREFQTKSTLLK